jgi:hypothetical protein
VITLFAALLAPPELQDMTLSIVSGVHASGYNSKPEVHTDPETGHRAADTWVDDWEFGNPSAHDWVVTHTCQQKAVERSTPKPNFALEESEVRKVSYVRERCEKRGIKFIPMAIDTFGGLGELACGAIRRVVSRAKLRRGNDGSTSFRAITQRLQVSVFKGLARQILRRTHQSEYEDEEADTYIS